VTFAAKPYKELGDDAYSVAAAAETSIHVLAHGLVVAVSLQYFTTGHDPAAELPRVAELTRQAIGHL
jgi:hypothetical protein